MYVNNLKRQLSAVLESKFQCVPFKIYFKVFLLLLSVALKVLYHLYQNPLEPLPLSTMAALVNCLSFLLSF
jgi:hypothetical protein